MESGWKKRYERLSPVGKLRMARATISRCSWRVPVGFFPHEDVESYLVATLVPFIASSQLVRHLAVLQAELDRLDIEGLRTAVLRKSSVDIAHLDIQALEKLGGEINLPEYEAFV